MTLRKSHHIVQNRGNGQALARGAAFAPLRSWFQNRKRARRSAALLLTTTDSHADFRDMAFTFAVIALAAKLSAADGTPSRDEFLRFREAFPMPASEHEKIRQLFAMALRDGASASDHARRIAGLFPPMRHRRLLADVMKRLLDVAVADGPLQEAEEAVLREIAEAFHMGRRRFQRLLRTHLAQLKPADPYAVLGVKADWPDADIRRTYHRLMREYHPDSVQSRGGSADAVIVASRQVAQLNAAYQAIRTDRDF